MNSNIRWPDNTLPVKILCAPGLLTGLEIMAADGLLALPRIGLGIGGLLLGRRLDGAVHIARSAPIDCSHALGPAFVLTSEELAASLTAVDPASEIVGWYCSKTQGSIDLSEHDLNLFNTLCPERWQVVLLIRPNKGKVTQAIFGIREGTGCLLGTPRDLAWQELAAFQVAPAPAPVAVPPVVVPPVVAEPTVAPPVASPITDEPAEVAVALPRSGTLFGVPYGPIATRKPRRWPMRLLIAAVLLAILAAAAYFSREYWLPKSPVALLASSDWRGLVSVLWNGEALNEQSEATLVVADGSGLLHTVHLNPAGGRAGWYQLDCRPGHVTVTLLAGNLSEAMTLTARAETYLPESGISK